MKMSKLFVTVFNDELISRGFKRKGTLFYRMNGEMLQGVHIEPINPYSIDCCSFPYWLFDDFSGACTNVALVKGYWTEGQGFEIGVPGTAYYREENETLNLDYMTACFEVAKRYALPMLDKLTDIPSYMQNINYNWKTDSEDKGEYFYNISSELTKKYDSYPGELSGLHMYCRTGFISQIQHLYLYDSYLKNSFEFGYRVISDKINKEIDERAECFNSLVQKGKMDADKARKDIQEIRETYEDSVSVFYTKMRQNNLDWILEYKEERKKEILPRLRDELGIDTFNL